MNKPFQWKEVSANSSCTRVGQRGVGKTLSWFHQRGAWLIQTHPQSARRTRCDEHITGCLGSSLATNHPTGLKSYSFAWHIGFWAPSHKGKNDFIRDKSTNCVGWGKRSSCLQNQKIDLGFQSFCWKGGKLDLGPVAQTRRKMERKRWVRTCKHTPGQLGSIIPPWFQNEDIQLSRGEEGGRQQYLLCQALCRGATRNISFSFSKKPVIVYHQSHLLLRKPKTQRL